MIYSVEDITKNYKDFSALSNINIEIKEPGIYGVLGPNGAGKTTFLKLMLKILNPTSGKIYYKDTNIERLGSSYYKEIGAVLEGNRNLYWYLTARQNLRYTGRLLGLAEADISSRTEELLKVMDLQEHGNKKVGYLSRGMQQKVAIMAALLHNPKVLFLDEPTLGLDIAAKNSMVKEIHRMADNGATIFLTTHQIDVLEQLTNSLFIIEKGKLTYQGSIDGLLKQYENSNDVHIVISKTEKGNSFLRDGMLKKNVVIKDEGETYHLVIADMTLQEINLIIKMLVQQEINIISVETEKPNLEETLLKFWRYQHE
ncbi:MAG: ABC transporter ATP-binding protein [Lachnospiraceae bacterium]